MSATTLDQIVTHLQFLGYEIVQKGEARIAKHPKKFNFAIREFKGGILFQLFNSCKDLAKSDRAGYLALINQMNNNAVVARFYTDKDSDLVIETWYPDYYERDKFGMFIGTWEADTLLILANVAEAEKYLK